MSSLLLNLKMAVRDNPGSALFLLVVGLIAFIFIGYLLIDFIRTQSMARRMRRRHHRHDHPLHEQNRT